MKKATTNTGVFYRFEETPNRYLHVFEVDNNLRISGMFSGKKAAAIWEDLTRIMYSTQSSFVIETMHADWSILDLPVNTDDYPEWVRQMSVNYHKIFAIAITDLKERYILTSLFEILELTKDNLTYQEGNKKYPNNPYAHILFATELQPELVKPAYENIKDKTIAHLKHLFKQDHE